MANPPQPNRPERVEADWRQSGGSDGQLRWLIEEQAGPSRGDATSYLRAAAHIDPYFRSRAIDELAVNRHRVPAPSFGFDLSAVLRECFAVRRRIASQAWAVLPALAVALILSPTGVVLGVALGLLASLLPSGGRLSTGKPGKGSMIATVAAAGIAAVLVLPSLFGMLGGFSGKALLAMLVVLVVTGITGYNLRLWTLRALTGKRGRPGPGSQVSGRHAALCDGLARKQSDRDVVYSSFGPFVGTGPRISEWSFAIELKPSAQHEADGRQPRPLSVPVIHAAIRNRLRDLGAGHEYPGDRLHRIDVQDYVFKPGVRPDSESAWLSGWERLAQTGTPRGEAGWPAEVDLAANERLRHFVVTRLGLWADEVVLTQFFRVSVQGGQLQVESQSFVLPPIAERFHAVDELVPPDSPGEQLAVAWYAVTHIGQVLTQSFAEPLRIALTAWNMRSQEDWYRKMRQERRPIDHSPRLSVRELAASAAYAQPFQEMDVSRLTAMVERRVHTAVLDCLRDHGYALGEYEARQDIQINNGIQISGGTVVGPMAAGRHARAAQTGKRNAGVTGETK
ncbi:hypothetical protein SGFS_028510 [Streptomyces graminofaciens]|uniref:Aromatic ring-opening dioxygenase LigA n=1 Tax=Streptomyces graminofaciens TaxID=68212 RepID=A0ABM7F6J7_9ACTN|nr:hypothetical protein [Streptomyces graminofaciens]BBC31557.1 hypothetical protein SGFS_028510 [Streptomyces graminofaciens]